nr:PREDICTED: LOW QUALITY PROTEIN: uncharacterized protein LOC105663387 [Megachile rotundata]
MSLDPGGTVVLCVSCTFGHGELLAFEDDYLQTKVHYRHTCDANMVPGDGKLLTVASLPSPPPPPAPTATITTGTRSLLAERLLLAQSPRRVGSQYTDTAPLTLQGAQSKQRIKDVGDGR